jgi:hypothetical protein
MAKRQHYGGSMAVGLGVMTARMEAAAVLVLLTKHLATQSNERRKKAPAKT